jgi:hypothetical protein
MAEQLDEPLDSRIPEAFVPAEPTIRALERTGIDAAVVNSSAHGALHESRPLQGLDVLRRRGERHPVWCRELANSLLALGEPLEHGAPRVVAERAEDEVESRVLMFNHDVEYTNRPLNVNRMVEGWSFRSAAPCAHEARGGS